MTVDVRDGDLWLDGVRVELERAVWAAEALPDGSIAVLFDLAVESSTSWRTLSNLISVNKQGHRRWTAALPETHADAYVAIVSAEPFVVQSYSGYRCMLDPDTGKITDREFTK